MYIPSSFHIVDTAMMHNLMRDYPLGLLISSGSRETQASLASLTLCRESASGNWGIQASPVPFLLCTDEAGNDVLRAHIARGNPHWKGLKDAEECLVVFQGPDGYVLPPWYPSKALTHKAVPTWNYATVHAWGRPLVIEDKDWIRQQLADITLSEEGRRAHPWSLDDAPADFIDAQMKAVVGIEIRVTRLEGKWKMSQNRDDADKQGVIDGMRDITDPHRNEDVASIVAEYPFPIALLP